jgi:putative aldouronate transport system substrate-binding protein
MEKGGNYVVAPATSYSASAKDDELKTTWAQVTTSIKENSWKAIYAKTDAEYNKCVQKMKKDTAAYGYDKCLKWCENEAATRRSLEKALSN